jgi:hypothetical protein
LTRSLSVIALAMPRAFVSDTLSAMTRPMSSAVSCFRSNSEPFPAAASCSSRCAIWCLCVAFAPALRLARLGLPVKMMIGGVTGWVDEGFTLTAS